MKQKTNFKLRVNWPMGFFGFLAFFGLKYFSTDNWVYLFWFFWVVWFVNFIPIKKDENKNN